MTERRSQHAPEIGAGGGEEGFDREIHLRGIVWTAAGIVAVTIVSMIVVWYLAVGLKRGLVTADPGPTAVEQQERARARDEAAARPAPPAAAFGGGGLQLPAGTLLPPGPQLQPSPEVDMAALLAAEDRELASYGWIDRERGIVRVPIDRAIDDLVAEGLPQLAPAPAAGAEPENLDAPMAPMAPMPPMPPIPSPVP